MRKPRNPVPKKVFGRVKKPQSSQLKHIRCTYKPVRYNQLTQTTINGHETPLSSPALVVCQLV